VRTGLTRKLALALAAAGTLALLLRRRRRPRLPARLSGGARPRALITGASSGIGAEFARQLAAQGYNLVLCARREERLRALAGELAQAHGVTADTLVADLAKPEGIEAAAQYIAGLADLEILVNNAGFGTEGRFARADAGRESDMVSVHMAAPVRLSRAALPGMLARGRGAIINVSSVAASFPLPGNVLYSSSKAFLNAFSRALHVEVDGTGVRVQALCPGFTITEFHDPLGRFERRRIPAFLWMQAEDVVAQSLAALWDGPVVFVPGRLYPLIAALGRLPFLDPVLRIGTRLVLRGRTELTQHAPPDTVKLRHDAGGRPDVVVQ